MKMHEFDPKRAAFETWVIMWARALMINYVRRSTGFRNPYGGREISEADLFTGEDKDGAEQSNAYESAVDTKTLSRDPLASESIIQSTLEFYRGNLADFPLYESVFELLLANDFELSAREISRQLGISHTTVCHIIADIRAELGCLLVASGIDHIRR